MMRSLRTYTTEWQKITSEEAAAKWGQVMDALRELMDYVDDHRLYFSDELGDSLEAVAGKVMAKAIEFEAYVVEAAEDEELRKTRSKNWTRIAKEVMSDGKEVLSGLRKEFQEIIGIKA